MADYTAAAETIKRLAVQFQGLVDVADALTQVGSLDNAVNERTTAFNAAKQKHESVLADVDAAEKALDDIKSQAAAIIADAKAQAQAMLDQANVSIGKVMDAANAQAQQITMAAQASALNEAGRISSEVTALQSQKDALNKDLNDLDDAVATKATELAALTAKIEAAQEQIAKIFGK